jgi:DNA-binding Lrp family transcriptional regulator
MLDEFDLQLLNIVQRDDARTADSIAEEVPLSPSAISRRLRRLRTEGWIHRSVALLSPELTDGRLQALVFIQLDRRTSHEGKLAVEEKLLLSEYIQFCCEISGPHDLLVLFDCKSMAHFMAEGEGLIAADPAVAYYETYFIKRRVKFAPFIDLLGPSLQMADNEPRVRPRRDR